MALDLTALATTFQAQMVRAWNRTSVTLQNMNFASGGGQGGGKQLGWDVQFSGATAASFAAGADVTVFDNDDEKPATLPWGQYQSKFRLTNLEINQAANNIGNARELEKIVEERFYDAICAITAKINSDIIVGTGLDGSSNPTIVGLLTALNAATTYGTLSKVTYPEWAGNEQANGGTPRALTLDLLALAEQSQYTRSGMSPELLITTPAIKRKYEGLFNSVLRVSPPNGSGSPIQRYDASAEDLFWRGRQIVREKDMTAGKLIGVRASGLTLHVLPQSPVPDMVPTRVAELVSSNGEMSKNLGAFVNVYPLARTGSAVKFVAEIYCQLRVARPNEHFIIADINES